jgi:hypothetical protein
MSVSSILAFVLAGVAAKAKSVQGAWPSEDRIAGLIARIAALEDDIARANVQARRDQELIDIWRERALANVPALQAPPVPDMALRGAAIALHHQALQQSQANALNAQNHPAQQLAQYQNYQPAQQNQLGQAMGLPGAQSLIDAELWCNCVPSRSQVWATSDPE